MKILLTVITLGILSQSIYADHAEDKETNGRHSIINGIVVPNPNPGGLINGIRVPNKPGGIINGIRVPTPGVKYTTLKEVVAGGGKVDMGLDHHTLVVSIKKHPLERSFADVVKTYLADCKIKKWSYGGNEDILTVSFEPENDGGYNYCQIKVQQGSKTYTIELGAKTGE